MSNPKSGGSKLTPERARNMSKAAMGKKLNENELDSLSKKIEIDDLTKSYLDKIKEREDIINKLQRQNKQLEFQNNLLLNAGTENSTTAKQMINEMEEMKELNEMIRKKMINEMEEMKELNEMIRNDSNKVKLENEQLKLENDQLKLENKQLQDLINKNYPQLSSGGKYALRIL